MPNIIMSKFKVFNHMEALKKIAVGDFTAPPIASEIDISNFCNNDCSFCAYKDFLSREKVKISYEDFCRVASELSAFGIKTMGFTGGGEPLTHDKAIEMFAFAKSLGLEVSLVTNGALLREDMFDSLIVSCTYIRFSISGATNETFQKIQRPKNGESLEILFEKIGRIVDRRNMAGRKTPMIGIAFLVCIDNINETYQIAERAKVCGADYIVYRPAVGQKQIGKRNYKFGLSEISRAISTLSSPDFAVYSSLAMDQIEELDGFKKKLFTSCRGHALIAIITANLKVTLCCQSRAKAGMELGDLHNESFSSIWLGEKRKSVYNNIDLSKCGPCRYAWYNEALEYFSSIHNLEPQSSHLNWL